MHFSADNFEHAVIPIFNECIGFPSLWEVQQSERKYSEWVDNVGRAMEKQTFDHLSDHKPSCPRSFCRLVAWDGILGIKSVCSEILYVFKTEILVMQDFSTSSQSSARNL